MQFSIQDWNIHTLGPWLVRFFRSGKKSAWTKFTALKPLVTKNAWVKEFLHIFSENRISWIFGLFLENVHKWKLHHWNPQEPRTLCSWLQNYFGLIVIKAGQSNQQKRGNFSQRVPIFHGCLWLKSKPNAFMFLQASEVRKAGLSALKCWNSVTCDTFFVLNHLYKSLTL